MIPTLLKTRILYGCKIRSGGRSLVQPKVQTLLAFPSHIRFDVPSSAHYHLSEELAQNFLRIYNSTKQYKKRGVSAAAWNDKFDTTLVVGHLSFICSGTVFRSQRRIIVVKDGGRERAIAVRHRPQCEAGSKSEQRIIHVLFPTRLRKLDRFQIAMALVSIPLEQDGRKGNYYLGQGKSKAENTSNTNRHSAGG